MDTPTIIVLVLIIFLTFIGYTSGLVMAVINLSSWVISIIVARLVYPIITKMLANTFIFTDISNRIKESLNLTGLVETQASSVITSLPLPSSFIDLLMENNNSEVYNMLNVSNVEDYISGFITVIILNIVSFILVTVLILLLLHGLKFGAKLIEKIPVVSTFNRLGGAIFGFMNAMIIVWLVMILWPIFTGPEGYLSFVSRIYESPLLTFIYENNYLERIVFKMILI